MIRINSLRITLIIIVLIVMATISQIAREARSYNAAIDCIRFEDYEKAESILIKLGDYRDSRLLMEYIDIMQSLDPLSKGSVYVSYRDIMQVIDRYGNGTLRNTIERDKEKINAMYTDLNAELCVKGMG